MKTEIQLKLKEMVEELTYNDSPLFDNIVVNFRKEEDYDSEQENLSGSSGCIISLKTLKFDERAIRQKMNEIKADGFMAMIFKKNHPNYDDIIEFAPERVAVMLFQNRTLDGLVRDCYPTLIDHNLYRSDSIGVFTMVDFQFRVHSKFFLTREE